MKYLLGLIVGVLILTGCTDSGVNEKPAPEDDVFLLEGETLVPNGPAATFFTDNQKLKGANIQDISEEQKKALKETLLNYSKKKKSSFVAFISYKRDNKFKYRYFRLNPNKEDLEASSGKNLFKYIIFVDPETKEPYRVIAAIIPETKNQKQAVLDWASRFGFKPENKKTKSTSSKQKTTMHCYWQEVGYFDPELGGIYHEYTIWVCEEQTLDPGGDDGGGTGCDYSGGSCEEDPPINDDGGGSTGDPNTSSCPTGQVEDINGDCINGEMPCEGNPIKNPRIARQLQNSGMEGGRFRIGDDAVRASGTRDHKGTDFLVNHGEPVFSLHDNGRVRAIRTSNTLGKYIIVSYDIEGIEVWMLYGHLNTTEVGYGTISKGTVIGTTGVSGNLWMAIRDSFALQHIHVEAREGGWSNKSPKDPESYIKTKFDSNGNPISATDC